jgi:hypothetical protein
MLKIDELKIAMMEINADRYARGVNGADNIRFVFISKIIHKYIIHIIHIIHIIYIYI